MSDKKKLTFGRVFRALVSLADDVPPGQLLELAFLVARYYANDGRLDPRELLDIADRAFALIVHVARTRGDEKAAEVIADLAELLDGLEPGSPGRRLIDAIGGAVRGRAEPDVDANAPKPTSRPLDEEGNPAARIDRPTNDESPLASDDEEPDPAALNRRKRGRRRRR